MRFESASAIHALAAVLSLRNGWLTEIATTTLCRPHDLRWITNGSVTLAIVAWLLT